MHQNQLALGSYTGGVAVVNLAVDSAEVDAVIGQHSEPITGLEWVPPLDLSIGSSHRHQDMVLSTGLDGRMVLWTCDGSVLTPLKVPRRLRQRAGLYFLHSEMIVQNGSKRSR